MSLTLEALPALHGDSLLLHFGTKNDPGLIVIDGGPKTVYANTLRPRLEEIKAERSPDDPLPIRLVMVSHIDDDHIRGILDLSDELNDATPNQRPFAVQELWHNAFTDILGDADDELLAASGKAAKISETGEVPIAVSRDHPSAAIIASVPQGRKLRDTAHKLGWVVNDSRPLLMAGDTTKGRKDTIDLGSKLTLTILGPTRDRLLKLQKEWMKDVKPKKPAGAKVVEYLDTSAPNLSSLIVYATDGTRKILLTGDGRGDFILEGIEAAKLLTKGKLAIDVLKVPHHGSIRDLDKDFFETIIADDYVISADGKFDNPDIPSLELLLAARGNAPYTIHLTYPVDAFDPAYNRKALQKLIDGSKNKKYKIVPREAKAKSVVV